LEVLDDQDGALSADSIGGDGGLAVTIFVAEDSPKLRLSGDLRGVSVETFRVVGRTGSSLGAEPTGGSGPDTGQVRLKTIPGGQSGLEG